VLKLSSAAAASASDLICSIMHNDCIPPKLHAVHCILSKPGMDLHVIPLAPLLLAVTHHHSSFQI